MENKELLTIEYGYLVNKGERNTRKVVLMSHYQHQHESRLQDTKPPISCVLTNGYSFVFKKITTLDSYMAIVIMLSCTGIFISTG